MKTANIIIGLHDHPDDMRPRKPPAVHYAFVVGHEESIRYFPVCEVNPHEGWTAEDTADPASCKRCLAWPGWENVRLGLFGALTAALVGQVHQKIWHLEGGTCTGCGGINDHKPGCPWPMLNEMLGLE